MRRLLLCAASAVLIPAAWAAKPHEHGAARLDIAVENRTVTIALESPLDRLLGFERAPRTAAERQAVEAMTATLQCCRTLFRIDPAAQCSVAKVALSSAVLKLGDAAAANDKKDDGHGDLDADFEFNCQAAPAFVEVGLFAAFPRMARIEVQTATAQGPAQGGAEAPGPAHRAGAVAPGPAA